MSQLGRTAIRTLRLVGLLVAAVLVAFHGWLLMLRIARGDFGWVDLVRWLAAFAVLGAMSELYRRNGGLRGRQAIVLGLLVVALHVGATPPAVDSGLPGHHAEGFFLLPVAIAPTAAALLLLCFIAGPGNSAAWRGPVVRLALAGVPACRDNAVIALFSRPPPR